MKSILRMLVGWFFNVKVINNAKFNSDKQLIIANHQSFIDGLLIGLFLPISPTFVVHTTVLHKWFFRFLLSLVDYIAVDTTKPMSMKKVAALINQGKPVVIFPEGRITLTGSLMKVYDGTAFIAYKTQAAVIPVWIDGAVYTKFSRKHNHPRTFRSDITITISPETSITVDESVPISAKIKRKKAGEQMRKIMQNAMFNAQPKETLWQRLLRTISIYGKNAPVISDKDQLENPKLAPLTYKDMMNYPPLKLVLIVGVS